MTAVGAVAFFVLLLFAIAFHEFGHFITARWAGIKIRQFFIGFGPTLWSVRRGQTERVLVDASGKVVEPREAAGVEDPSSLRLTERPETEYGIKALPLGGYVKVVGMSPFEEVPPEESSRSFRAASGVKRVIVLVAGSVTHFITAFVVLVLLFSLIGIPDPERPTLTVQSVFTEFEDGAPAPAYTAGMRPEDRITEINGRPAGGWQDLREAIRNSPREALTLTLESRAGEARTVRLTPAAIDEQGQTVGVIGVVPELATTRVNPVAGAARSAGVMWTLTTMFVTFAPRAFTPENLGLIPGREPGDDRALSIYGAGRLAAQAANEGLPTFLFLFVNLNLFVGLFNLVPLPPLDGGHLLLLGVEKLRGKPVGQRTLARAMAVGFALLVALGITLLYQDIVAPLQSPFQQ